MSSYITILRPANGLMSALAVWIGSLLAAGPVIPGREIIYTMAAVFLVSGAGMAVNDIFDIEIDRRNKPKRPIPAGKISPAKAKAYAAVLFIAGNFLGMLVSQQAFYLTLLASVLLITYAWKLKKVLVAGHVAVSFLVALSFFFGGLIQGNLLASLWIGLLSFLANMGREIYKTIDDMLGDREAHVNSIALKWGAMQAKTLASVFVLAAVLLSFAPYVLGEMNEVYLFFVIVADIAFVSAIGAPVKYSSKLVKVGMLIALLAFILGAPQVQGLI